jgi:hypothetical protein
MQKVRKIRKEKVPALITDLTARMYKKCTVNIADFQDPLLRKKPSKLFTA